MVWFASLLLFFLLQSPSTVKTAEPPGGYYTTRYDHLDIENILNQKRLVHYYAACLLDKGPCTPQGIEFKNILPEAVKTNCLRCTEKQRVVTLRSIRRLRKEYPDIWRQLEASWDPTGVYIKRLEESVNKPIPNPTLLSSTNIVENTVTLSNRFDDQTDHKRVPEDITSKRTIVSSFSPPSSLQTSKPSVTSPKPSPTTSKFIESTSPISTTLKFLITTLQPNTTPKYSTTTSIYRVTKRIITRPFSSIGPNLVVPNPKALIDKVISTAGAVLNSVTNTVTNTVVTVFKG
ncbi:uncharacterized protein [Onthophagus taurus]|uniref:uncharacterized protein n=1 Tax=Onthophagus taurus TaxID=166361 RepID=UPI000C202A4F|nr:uncharacterized protein LOC111421898 [Onthophagus taurus]